jgi:peptidoglycan/xylan/chitin deacetylase (PgdA/CDA1 family)
MSSEAGKIKPRVIKPERLPPWLLRAGAGLALGLLAALIACLAIGMVLFLPPGDAGWRPAALAALATTTPQPTEEPTATTGVFPSPSQPPAASPTPTATEMIRPTERPLPTDPSEPTPPPAPVHTPLPGMFPDSVSRELRVPILMYHYISDPPADADVYRLDLSVTPEHFRQQMAWLKDNGYQAVTLYDLMYALNMGRPRLPEKPVIITFDDGYIDNYQFAFPILQEFGFTGAFFILTDVTDRGQPGYMTWDMLREMSVAGMQIEVHGREHVEMINRDHDFLVFHLLGPAQTIEANLGYTPRFVAYPSGRYDSLVIDVAREVGYWGGLTTIFGTTQYKSAPFELQRLRVRGSWSLAVFAEVVTGS